MPPPNKSRGVGVGSSHYFGGIDGYLKGTRIPEPDLPPLGNFNDIPNATQNYYPVRPPGDPALANQSIQAYLDRLLRDQAGVIDNSNAGYVPSQLWTHGTDAPSRQSDMMRKSDEPRNSGAVQGGADATPYNPSGPSFAELPSSHYEDHPYNPSGPQFANLPGNNYSVDMSPNDLYDDTPGPAESGQPAGVFAELPHYQLPGTAPYEPDPGPTYKPSDPRFTEISGSHYDDPYNPSGPDPLSMPETVYEPPAPDRSSPSVAGTDIRDFGGGFRNNITGFVDNAYSNPPQYWNTPLAQMNFGGGYPAVAGGDVQYANTSSHTPGDSNLAPPSSEAEAAGARDTAARKASGELNPDGTDPVNGRAVSPQVRAAQPADPNQILFANLGSNKPWNVGAVPVTPGNPLYIQNGVVHDIGGAPADVRFAANSGTGNYTAEQTTKGFLLGGGYSGAPNNMRGTPESGRNQFDPSTGYTGSIDPDTGIITRGPHTAFNWGDIFRMTQSQMAGAPTGVANTAALNAWMQKQPAYQAWRAKHPAKHG